MANFNIVCALLVACCVFTSVDHTMSAPKSVTTSAPTTAPTPLTKNFLHDHTGRLVRGQPSQGPVTADGVSKGQFHYVIHTQHTTSLSPSRTVVCLSLIHI